jgi:hypothetical protein
MTAMEESAVAPVLWAELLANSIARKVFVEAAPGCGSLTLVETMLSLVFLLCMSLVLGLALRHHPVVASGEAALQGNKLPELKCTSLLSLGLGLLPGLTPYRIVAAVKRPQYADPQGRGAPRLAAIGLIRSARKSCGDSLVPPFGE